MPKARTVRTLLSLLGCLFLAAFVSGAVAAQSVREGLFSGRHQVLLVFDLQDDTRPKAALVVNRPAQPADIINVPLLFHSDPLQANEEGLFRVGHYDDWTLITFSGMGQSWPQQVSFTPHISRTSDPEDAVSANSSPVYLVAQGQLRRFQYRYPTEESIARATEGAPQTVLTLPDAIAVAIPTDARELAVSDGRLSIPERINRDERVFPGRPTEPGEPYLKLAYEVPPTAGQKLLVESGVKLIGALVPFLLLLFIPKSEIVRPGLLRWVIGISFAVMLILIALTIRAAIRTENIMEVVPDMVVLIIGLVAAGITFLVKKN